MEHGTWNLKLLRVWFPKDVIHHIISVPPPFPFVGPDLISWSHTALSAFSVKNAYWMLKEESWNPKDVDWNSVWKFPRLQRVGNLIWIVLKHKILTNAKRVWRGIGWDESCPLCGYGIEDGLHMLRDCPNEKDFWNHFIPAAQQSHFFYGNLLEWLISNL